MFILISKDMSGLKTSFCLHSILPWFPYAEVLKSLGSKPKKTIFSRTILHLYNQLLFLSNEVWIADFQTVLQDSSFSLNV